MPESIELLIVDDESIIRDLIRECLYLIKLKFGRVHTAANGKEALGLLRRHKIDLILTDMKMPGIDGLGLMAELASDERLSKVPVVVITAYSSPEELSQVALLGVREVLGKPFTPEQLESCMRRALGVPSV